MKLNGIAPQTVASILCWRPGLLELAVGLCSTVRAWDLALQSKVSWLLASDWSELVQPFRHPAYFDSFATFAILVQRDSVFWPLYRDWPRWTTAKQTQNGRWLQSRGFDHSLLQNYQPEKYHFWAECCNWDASYRAHFGNGTGGNWGQTNRITGHKDCRSDINYTLGIRTKRLPAFRETSASFRRSALCRKSSPTCRLRLSLFIMWSCRFCSQRSQEIWFASFDLRARFSIRTWLTFWVFEMLSWLRITLSCCQKTKSDPFTCWDTETTPFRWELGWCR